MLLLFLIKEVIPLNKADLIKFFNGTKAKLSKNAPAILIGLSVVSGGAAIVLAVSETPKALKRIDDAKAEKQVDKLTPMDTVKATWTCYLPAAGAFIFSTACAIGSQSVNAKRNAALAAAYKISETALLEYKDKVVETIGEKKEKTVRDKVVQEHIDKTPVVQSEVIRTGKGTSLCLDPLSKRYFESDMSAIRRVESKLNQAMMLSVCGSASLNEFYIDLGLEPVDDSIGDQLGWNSMYPINLDIRPGMTPDERPCLVLYHDNPPKYGF